MKNPRKLNLNRKASKIRHDNDKPKGVKKNDIACKELQEDGFSRLTPLTLKRLQSKPINFWAFFFLCLTALSAFCWLPNALSKC